MAEYRHQIEPSKHFAACGAVALGGARDPSAPDPRVIVKKLHVDRGRACGHLLMRVLVDLGEGTNGCWAARAMW